MTLITNLSPAGAHREHHHGEFDVDTLVRTKRGRSVSVCIPARDEVETIGDIVRTLHTDLVRPGVVDEIIVVDDHSTDDTAAAATAAGATVADASTIESAVTTGPGKGEALWKSMFVAGGEIIAWCDADIREFSDRFVRGILGPLLADEEIQFVKGHYERSGPNGGKGGRVTELLARPLLATFFPSLAGVPQPLSGEYGGRRAALEQLAFSTGYGVDVGLLIDISLAHGPGAIATTDLDRRTHRNRPLDDLALQATAVSSAILGRAGVDVPAAVDVPRPDGSVATVSSELLPAPVEVASYLALTG